MKLTIMIKPEAFLKLRTLIDEENAEVAWHMTTRRIQYEDNTTVIIKDVILFPQYTTATHVYTDQAEYEDWLEGLPNNVFRKLRGHGHSHVNMSPIASATDKKHQRSIAEMIKGDNYYLWMIWNKRHEATAYYVGRETNYQVQKFNDFEVLIDAGDPNAIKRELKMNENIRHITESEAGKYGLTKEL